MAILVVFIFHLAPTVLPAGFLGVDLFFAVSGFLMTYLYGDLSGTPWRHFWFKRVKRILPAYFVVVLATLVVSFFLLLPHEFGDVSASAVFASLLTPNIGFWSASSYFANDYFRPLLHLWSLGVEAQFYVLFPLIALTTRRSPLLLLALAVASFVACSEVTEISPKTSFFLTPFRLWEFCAGMLAAKCITNPRIQLLTAKMRPLGVFALALIVASCFLRIPETAHPGAATLPVILGTVTVLIVGLPGALLSNPITRTLILFGRYSYSIYLVHFPVISLIGYRPFHGGEIANYTPASVLAIITLTSVLSWLLFHLIEQPTRNNTTPRNFAFVQVGLMSACLVFAPLAPHLQRLQFTPSERRILQAWNDRSEYRCGKFWRILAPTARSCPLSTGSRVVLLVGDSHADAIKVELARAAAQLDISLRLMVANCAAGQPSCSPDEVLAEARLHDASAIVLHSSPENSAPEAILSLAAAADDANTELVLIEPVPVWHANVIQSLWQNRSGDHGETQTIQDYERHNAVLFSALEHAKQTSIRRVEVARRLCRPVCRQMNATGSPLYFDRSHLTQTGASELRREFDELFAQLTASAVPHPTTTE